MARGVLLKRMSVSVRNSDLSMIRGGVLSLLIVFSFFSGARAGEKTVVLLRDFRTTELKSAGLVLPRPTTLHIVARGAAGSKCDREKKGKGDDMFAYGWILDADRREVVWTMTSENTSRARDDRTFDDYVTLPQGSYELYFVAATFTYVSTFKNLSMNVDHREAGVFNMGISSNKRERGWLEGWFDKLFGDDVREEWEKRSKNWGMEVFVDERYASSVTSFTPPKEFSDVLVKATRLGEDEFIRQTFAVSDPMTVRLYALGEGLGGDYELADYGWIVNLRDRSRVWEMQWRNAQHAGGASKNLKFDGQVFLPKGEYTLYYVTDNSHSAVDWNCGPPADPLNYGITVLAVSEKDKAHFKLLSNVDEGYAFVSLTKMRNSESRSEGFTLKHDARIRVYAIGERSNQRRLMADYAVILDARSRTKVWTMDVDRTSHAGGASKNRVIDEIITLPKGSYIVRYVTDDSHAYGDWNADPPYDAERYGITLYGVGESFDRSWVSKYIEQRDKYAIAQIIRVGSSENKSVRFKLDKTTRVRVYALGEGFSREMADYGWITDNTTGMTVWEMTYSMTTHAGGARKNRLVNTTIILDKGQYTLHYSTDDSHAYGDWNSDPPEDPEYWGITLYTEEGSPPVPPDPPKPPGN